MTPDETRAFLADGRRVGKVATTLADGGPHVVPVWYALDGDDIVFSCARDSVKGRNLARDPRAAVSVDDEEFPYSFVSVSGGVRFADRPPDLLAWTTRIARRYVGDARAEELGRRDAELDDLVVRLALERVFGGADVAL